MTLTSMKTQVLGRKQTNLGIISKVSYRKCYKIQLDENLRNIPDTYKSNISNIHTTAEEVWQQKKVIRLGRITKTKKLYHKWLNINL